jgi:hypothetical protein
MATRLQVTQLVVLTDIRETRLQRLLAEAIVALELADTELDNASKAITRRTFDAANANDDFAKRPENEMLRIWRDVCIQRLIAAQTAHDSAQIERGEANERLTKARYDVLRIKERGSRIADFGKDLRRAEIRHAEARVEDDMPAMRTNVLMLESRE